ncbi:MAG: GNAT family N-acetyltransferase [candidate division KSB1 bacterium]|nr:GNAT family N-acetyltransferase [candidate division KSB1 bacterium]MDZ7273905.1 GNAT family N-acetyltransferase [candidate division KSB1 bacterium]MDZ7286061.1 GNAT family N-acetyltransferase [candidate division KSB1 bacterium]MDZ7299093.1 GNAT family N-acetyltransferase [candidate division KSB1 bacterium]MDZ7306396.1 GNAT family N-acetyltransferase [candidate division KSB1 bacterium]
MTPPLVVRRFPPFPEQLPDFELVEGNYHLRFVRSEAELDAVLKLRFEVFNLELGEGLDSSHETFRDEDHFDSRCHHVMVLDRALQQVVGTYRMQTLAMAGSREGFYAAGEYDLSGFPAGLLEHAVEIGRACVARPHRSARVLYLLWRGLAAYLTFHRKRYLFGCCSLTSQDPATAAWLMEYLLAHGRVHPDFLLQPHADYACYDETFKVRSGPAVMPALMKIYLIYGAKICSLPARDRLFKTIDYLMLLDTESLDQATRRFFFREQAAP